MTPLHTLALTTRRVQRDDLAFSALPQAPVVDAPSGGTLLTRLVARFSRRPRQQQDPAPRTPRRARRRAVELAR